MKTLADQVRSYMHARGEGYSPAMLASEVARHQSALPLRNRCRRQNIEQLLQKGFSHPKYIDALAAVLGTTVDVLLKGKYEPPAEAGVDGGISVDAPVPPSLSREKATALVPPPPGARFLLYRLSEMFGKLDPTDRVAASAILSELALNPDTVELMAFKLERLLGEIPTPQNELETKVRVNK